METLVSYSAFSLPSHSIPRTRSSAQTTATKSNREKCFRCFRPGNDCYCEHLPEIDNKTEIVIVQHVRERDHPFNTARMVRLALNQCNLYCGNNQALASRDFQLKPNSGLIFPSRQSKTLADLPPSERPDQLVFIDGTWPQARTMIRDLTQLHHLPHYKLSPTQPGQYRIRLEPNETALSTVEAVVEALRELEPETERLDDLLRTFNVMVQRQLDHPKVGREHYSGGPKSGRTTNVPYQLLGDADSIVVAYGEAAYRPSFEAGSNPYPSRPPLYWVAKRLGTNEFFSQAIKPSVPLTDSFLQHLELQTSDFDDSVSAEDFCNKWQSFLRPNDVVVVYNKGTLNLLKNIDANFCHGITLKSINFDAKLSAKSLVEILASQRNSSVHPAVLGRAGKRLANAIDLVEILRDKQPMNS